MENFNIEYSEDLNIPATPEELFDREKADEALAEVLVYIGKRKNNDNKISTR